MTDNPLNTGLSFPNGWFSESSASLAGRFRLACGKFSPFLADESGVRIQFLWAIQSMSRIAS